MKKTTHKHLKKYLLLLVFASFTALSYAQPANDLCSGAIPLTVGTTCTNSLAVFNGAQTDSGIADPGCAFYAGGDIWFSLVMPASGTVRVKSSYNGTIDDGGMAAYSGTDCNTLNLIDCDDDGNVVDGEGAGGGFELLDITQPTGSIIYIRLWAFNNATIIGDYNVCAFEYTPPPPPANDDCINALTLTVASTCMPIIGTNLGATASEIADATIPDPGCASYSGGDVWFKLIVPPTGHFEVETYEDDLSITDGGMAIYSGNCDPNGLLLLACDDDSGIITGEAFERIELTRTPGETLYIRVWAYSNNEVGTFNICAVELTTLSITNNKANTFSISPNPASEVINISFTKAIDNIEIYDLLGKLVLNKNNNTSTVQINHLQNGVYLLKIFSENRIITKKFVKQ